MRKRITNVIEDWFLSEPLMFQVFCAHEIVENTKMECALRSGQQRIEYNSWVLNSLSDKELREILKVEAIRILMKHPYMRKPDMCSDDIAALGSEMTIGDNYKFMLIDIATPWTYKLRKGMSYEYYCHRLQKMFSMDTQKMKNAQGVASKKQSDSDGNRSSDAQENGEQTQMLGGDVQKQMQGADGQNQMQGADERMQMLDADGQNQTLDGDGQKQRLDADKLKHMLGGDELNQTLDGDGQKQRLDADKQKQMLGGDEQNQMLGGGGCHPRQSDIAALWEENELMALTINSIIQNVQNWGTLSGDIVEAIKASTNTKINWRNVMSGFRASIISSRRIQTRMRPNRRTEFDNPGSRREFDTRLLVAVDVSGSVSSQAISDFYGVINRAFKYGFTEIDVCQFDTEIKSVKKINKKCTDVKVKGRGGTSFQEPVDFAFKKGYDGLIILTDGCAPKPTIPHTGHCKILWVCVDQDSFKKNKEWMQESGRACTMQLE